MALYRIHIDISPVLGAALGLQARLLPRVSAALSVVSEKTKALWIEQITAQKGIWLEEKNRYIRSINWRWVTPLSTEVWTDYAVAGLIEDGRPARDLKQYLNTSQKVRRTESGKRFLVIPFRHNTPGHNALASSMSPQAYAMAKGMTFSKVTSEHVVRPVGQMMRLNPRTGMTVSPHQTPFLSAIKTRGPALFTQGTAYQWGGRLSAKMLHAAGMDSADVKRYAGMTRFKDSAFKNHSGGYLTFRMMMEGQSGWIIPAQPGRHIVADVAREMEPIATATLQRAAKLDV